MNEATNPLEAIGAMMRVTQKEHNKEDSKVPNIISLTYTHAGAVSSDDKTMPPGVPDNFLYIKEACNKYVSLKESKREYGEAVYKKLLDEFEQNQGEWDRFFRHPANASHAGDACMCLDGLASIYKGRKDWESCEKVLVMMEFLLLFVKRHNDLPNRQHDMSNFIVKHEYTIISARYDMNIDLERYDESASIMRRGIEFETKHKFPHEFSLTYMFQEFCKAWNEMGKRPKVNVKRIDKVSDDTLIQLVQFPKTMEDKMRAQNPHDLRRVKEHSIQRTANRFGITVEELENSTGGKMILKLCANCNKQEATLGEWKNCNQCKAVAYCGKKCQVDHWRSGHKKTCAPAKKKNKK